MYVVQVAGPELSPQNPQNERPDKNLPCNLSVGEAETGNLQVVSRTSQATWRAKGK